MSTTVTEMERPATERNWSNSSTGSNLQLTSRLLIVTPFDDPHKVSRYRERVSHSISRRSSGFSVDSEAPLYNEKGDALPEEPVRNETIPQSIRRVLTSRVELGKFLTHNLYFQLLVVLLVAVDAVMVIVVDLQVTSHDQCVRNSDCPIGEPVLDSHDHIKDCTVNINKTKCAFLSGYRKCTYEATPAQVDTLAVLHYVGLAILSLFVLEVLLRIFSLGKDFFHKKLEVFDGFLVVTSFIFYTAYRVEEPFHAAAQAVALLILLRVWRMKRIVNGITTNTQKRNMGKKKHLQRQLRAYEEKDKTLCAELATLKEEVGKFRHLAENPDEAVPEGPPNVEIPETSM